jgi:hypothetical protein
VLFVVDGKGEKAIQLLQKIEAEMQVGIEQDLGIGMGLEGKSLSHKQFAQFAEIVDLPIVHDGTPALGIGHGLVTRCRSVDDRKPGVAQVHVSVVPGLPVIGPTVGQPGNCPRYQLGGMGLIRNESGYSAHGVKLGILVRECRGVMGSAGRRVQSLMRRA